MHFRGARFLFLLYVQNKFFWAQQIWGTQKIWGGTAPECNPVATGLAVRESYPQPSQLAFRILLPLPQYLCERVFFSSSSHQTGDTKSK